MKTTYTELLAMAHRRLKRHERAVLCAEMARDYAKVDQHEATIMNCNRLISYIHDACFASL